MTQILAEDLEKIGLQANEAKIYLALLELGQSTVTHISKLAGLNRTTGYDVLERLCLHGIANRSASSKKRLYIAEPPSRLRYFLENQKKQIGRRLEELENFLPDLQSLFKTELKPVIKFAEGKEAMINMYSHILDSKNTVYSILNLKGYAEIFDEVGASQSSERAKRGIKEKVLAIDSETARWWYNKTYKNNKKRQRATEYRWLKLDGRYSAAGEVNIFDDKVVGMLSKPSENVAFEIQSQTFADFLKIIFEMAWTKSTIK
ncbi:MAG: helix-turn-helix domain-containing protein [Patescibacteria group bacterium]|mgnify:CR=1 FL=1